MASTLKTAEQLQREWRDNPRWKGVERGYKAEDVVKLRGSVVIEHTLARRGAEKLWRLLNTEDKIFADSPALWVAQQLGKREDSPFKDKVHTGGKKEKGRYLITLKGIESAIEELLGASQLLGKIKDREKIYKLIEHYWTAAKLTWPLEWSNTRDFKLMTSTPGLSAVGQVGGKLLDIQLRKARVKPEDLELVVAQMKLLVDWRKSSQDMRGMAGPGAAGRVAEVLEKGLPEEVDIETIQV